jgi:S1-C subfamily serine protease
MVWPVPWSHCISAASLYAIRQDNAMWRKVSAIRLALSATVLLLLGLPLGAGGNSIRAAADASIWDAICPVVYPLDETSSNRGYHYVFYGNAFFVGKDGYLLTAAHVLSDLHDGGQPHIVIRRAEAPPRVIRVQVVNTDPQHDIALLRATPNPFEGKYHYQVTSLPLAAYKPQTGTVVFAAALRPSRLRDPHTFDAPQLERDEGDVLQYTTLKLDNLQPQAELFLFNHQVLRGQSGAPVLSSDGTQVVGIVEGQWLHSTPLSVAAEKGSGTPTVGAAIPITYAVALLEQHHILW